MKIKELPPQTNLCGIYIKNSRKFMVLRHAWPCGDKEIGMFLMTPKEYATGEGRLHPVFMTRTKFLNLEVYYDHFSMP